MGRPLNKKYFGNRNIGTNSGVTSDDHIGGEGLGLYTLGGLGSIIINATYPQPTLTIPGADITGGVQATATVVWEVESITVSNGLAGHSYVVTTGGATTLTGLAGVTANITAVGSGQGEVQTIVPVNRGSFTSVPRVATTYQIVGGDGNNQASVKYRVKSITTANSGSGYVSVPTLAWDDGGSHSGTMPDAPTVALVVDSGNVGSTTYQENAIMAIACTTSATPRSNSDIVKQQGSHAYVIKNSDGTAICKLVAKTPDTAGTCAIAAVDSDGGTYWVTKLTARKARLTANSGTQFATGKVVPWTMNGTNGTKVYATQPYLAAGVNVQITNA